jgi:hypothetical protein
MKQNGQRDAGGRGRIESRPSAQLKDLGITKDQSSQWQRLAEIPEREFEEETDEAKEIRDKARALEVYAKQAQNREAERKAAEIRIRAERRAGQLLKEMKDNGQREDNRGGDRKSRSRETTMKPSSRILASPKTNPRSGRGWRSEISVALLDTEIARSRN